MNDNLENFGETVVDIENSDQENNKKFTPAKILGGKPVIYGEAVIYGDAVTKYNKEPFFVK